MIKNVIDLIFANARKFKNKQKIICLKYCSKKILNLNLLEVKMDFSDSSCHYPRPQDVLDARRVVSLEYLANLPD